MAKEAGEGEGVFTKQCPSKENCVNFGETKKMCRGKLDQQKQLKVKVLGYFQKKLWYRVSEGRRQQIDKVSLSL